MSQYVKRVKNHVLHGTLQQLNLTLSKASKLTLTSGADELSRIKEVFKILEKAISSSNPILVVPLMFDKINQNLVPVNTGLNEFLKDRQVSRLTTCNQYIDNIIPEINSLLTADIRRSIPVTKNALEQLRNSSVSAVNHIAATKTKTEKELSILTSEIQKQKGHITEFVNEKSNEYSHNEATRDRHYKDAIKNWEAEYRKKITDLLENSKTTIDSLTSYKNQAEKIIGIIANTAMAGGYQKHADLAKMKATIWNYVTIGSITLLIICLFYIYGQTSDTSVFNLSQFVIRFAIVTAFLIMAKYSALQAKLNQSIEQKYRQLELELAAINPYLASLDDKVRLQIIKEFTYRYFGRFDVDNSPQVEPIPDITKLVMKQKPD